MSLPLVIVVEYKEGKMNKILSQFKEMENLYTTTP